MNTPESSAAQHPPAVTVHKGTVLLFGEVLADVFPDRTVLGGAPFNVARHLKAFGLNPVLISRLGCDALRDEVLDVMSKNNMSTLGIQSDNTYPTGQVQVHIENGGHRFEILPMQAYDFIHPAVVRMTTLSVHPELVYFGTLAQRNDTSRRALKALLRGTDAARFLDINLRTPWYNKETLENSLQQANMVKLNDDELIELAAMFELEGDSEQGQVRDLMTKFELDQVVVTCGEAGAWLMERDGSLTNVGIKNRVISPVDTVGAGDGFAAVTILGTLREWPVPVTLERANNFAAAICQIRGAIPDDVDFYQPYTKEWNL